MESLNWFLSTLSQSAAAIVGLTGAFMGIRLINQIDEVKSKRYDIKRRIGDFYNNINLQLEHFGLFKIFLRQQS